MTLSKERLEEILGDETYVMVMSSEIMDMARELLALRERERAEPVAWMLTDNEFGHSVATKAGFTLNFYRSKGWGVTPLYTAPPAPVVPDAYIRDGRGRMMLNGRQEPRIGYSAGWNACRAAMLKGTEDAAS